MLIPKLGRWISEASAVHPFAVLPHAKSTGDEQPCCEFRLSAAVLHITLLVLEMIA